MVDVERLDRLVEDLLALARTDEVAGTARYEPVDLDELVVAVLGGYANARVAVRTEVTGLQLRGRPERGRGGVLRRGRSARR